MVRGSEIDGREWRDETESEDCNPDKDVFWPAIADHSRGANSSPGEEDGDEKGTRRGLNGVKRGHGVM